MKPRTIRYYIKEALRSVIYNRFMSIASIFSVASSIFIVAVFYIIGANVEFFMVQMEDQMGLTVYIDDNLTSSEISRLEQRIIDIPYVSSARFVSRDEALDAMKRIIGEIATMGLENDNPLRHSFVIELTDLAYHDDVERALMNLRDYGAETIGSRADFANTLSTITSIVQIISAILVFVLATISVIIITNTIRITVNARKTEINIMKYVGATDWFIRWPFVIEGMIIGLLGGIGPAFICWFGYGRIINAINDIPLLDFVQFLPEENIMIYVFPFAIILGIAIGLLGSVTSVKRHLKV